MKTLHLIALIYSLTILSCTKTNTESINPSYNSNTADYSTLILGKWQLSEIGTTVYKSNETSFQPVTTWIKATTKEILTFNKTGEFIKEFEIFGLCKGSFQIISGHLMTKSMCQVEDNITQLTTSTLIFDTQNQKTSYKYVRIW